MKTNFARRCLACLAGALMLLSNPARPASAPANLCLPGGYVVGFFNGVFNTEADAADGLFALMDIDLSGQTNHEEVKYELFYNQTGLDRPGVTRFEDVIEVFRQRMAGQDALLANRWETFWEVLHGETGDGSVSGAIGAALSSVSDLFGALADDMMATLVAALAGNLSHPPTIQDYAAQKTLLDAHLTQKEKIILVAHSQGNLFSNVAYDYALPRAAPGSLQSVHIAPASPTVRGAHTLADLDLVINALRLSGSVPANNVQIPPLPFRPQPFDVTGHELVATYLDQRLEPYPQIAAQLQAAVAAAVTPPGGGGGNGFFTVTLTWDGAGDIDLHTFEPGGGHVYYAERVGASGELDTDNVTADGPEHFFATCDASRLQLGLYRIGINNYARGTGRTATVQVSTQSDGVLATTSLGVGDERGNGGNDAPIPVFNVRVATDAQNAYRVTVE